MRHEPSHQRSPQPWRAGRARRSAGGAARGGVPRNSELDKEADGRLSKIDRLRVAAGQRGGGCEIRTREGLHPPRFPTMRISVHHSPPPSATCPNTTGTVAGERRRTGVNEIKTETGGLAALYEAARPRS